jgi:hypothetical protein
MIINNSSVFVSCNALTFMLCGTRLEQRSVIEDWVIFSLVNRNIYSKDCIINKKFHYFSTVYFKKTPDNECVLLLVIK